MWSIMSSERSLTAALPVSSPTFHVRFCIQHAAAIVPNSSCSALDGMQLHSPRHDSASCQSLLQSADAAFRSPERPAPHLIAAPAT